MAPNLTLVPLQVFDHTPGESLSRYVKALDLAIDVKVDMLSMSVGWELSDLEHAQRNVLMRALHAVHRSGIFMVSSAGNKFGRVKDMFPCCFGGPTSMCVAYMYSNRTHNVLNPITNWGIRVDVAAYGNNIFTGRDEKGELRYFNGTSAAQPLVAGLIAILLSMDVDPRMAKSMVMANVDHVDCALPEDLPQSIRGGAINPLRTIKYAIKWLSSKSRGLRAAKRVGLLD
ncbi:hypothetical protein FOZ60_007474 [Perkinsus olseni]|uniref:subtilisin n=1 Tax=Perkinsus olseni TaxID=32597 RepID=A0A7J6PMP2_PEROL|nr:hypothetical protein FOZ60_007474 [Perkinsus olseni]